jgi:hypothetical protein
MNRYILGAGVAIALTAGIGARAQQMAMEKMEKTDPMASDKTYTGCVEKSDMGGYTLTHAMLADANGSEKAGSMEKRDPMMSTDAMKKDETMAHDAMASASLSLSAATPKVDLGRQVGHKVTVTGTEGDTMHGMATFKVKSVKAIRGSCG